MKWFVQVHEHHSSDGTRERIQVPGGLWLVHPGRAAKMSPLFSTQVGLCRVSPLWLQDQRPPRRPTAWEGVSPQEHMAAEGYRPCGFPKKLLRFPLVAAMAVWSWVQKRSICVFPLPVVFCLWEIPSLGFAGASLVSGISALAAPFSADSLHFHLSCSHFLWWPKGTGPVLPHPPLSPSPRGFGSPARPSVTTPSLPAHPQQLPDEVREYGRFLTLGWN